MRPTYYEAELYVDGVWKGSASSPDISGAIDTVLNFIPDILEFDTYYNKLNIEVIKKNPIVDDSVSNPETSNISKFMNEIIKVDEVCNDNR